MEYHALHVSVCHHLEEKQNTSWKWNRLRKNRNTDPSIPWPIDGSDLALVRRKVLPTSSLQGSYYTYQLGVFCLLRMQYEILVCKIYR